MWVQEQQLNVGAGTAARCGMQEQQLDVGAGTAAQCGCRNSSSMWVQEQQLDVGCRNNSSMWVQEQQLNVGAGQKLDEGWKKALQIHSTGQLRKPCARFTAHRTHNPITRASGSLVYLIYVSSICISYMYLKYVSGICI